METGTILEHYSGERYTVLHVGYYMMTNKRMIVMQSNVTFKIAIFEEDTIFDKVLVLDSLEPDNTIRQRFKIIKF